VTGQRLLASELGLERSGGQTGAVVGAVVGIVFANLVMDEEASAVRRIGLSIVSGAVVAMPGALVGGLFPKDR
jgi:hypothetical protein